MAKYDDIKRQLRQAIAEAERETRRLRAALAELEGAEEPSAPAAARRPRRGQQELDRLRGVVVNILTLGGLTMSARDVHLALVAQRELEDTKPDLEVARNLLRGLVKDGKADETGRGLYTLRPLFAQVPHSGGSGSEAGGESIPPIQAVS